MPSQLDEYRRLAVVSREAAASANLQQVKQMHLRSAAHFEGMVAKLESIARAKARNEAARSDAKSAADGDIQTAL